VQLDLAPKPKTATDLLNDLERYRQKRMSKAELTERWKGMQWCNSEMRLWAAWQWKEVVK